MRKALIIPAMLTVCLAVTSCGGNSAKKTCCDTEAAGACCATGGIKIITAHKFIKPEMVDEFIEFTRPIIEKSRAEEGCISYTLYQDPSDPTKFIFFEQWKDQAAIDYHFSTDHFKEAGSRPDFEAAPTVLTIYDACPVK